MSSRQLHIAIFSPSQNPYSETFIQAHKNHLTGKVFYYYGPKGRIQLEGEDNLVSKVTQWRYRVTRKLNNYPFSYINEQAVLRSLKAHGVNVILVEYGTHAYNLLELLKTSGLAVVIHFHGYDASISATIKSCNYYKEVFDMAANVIAVSKRMEEMLLDLGCPRHKLIYNVYGPQPEFETLQPIFNTKQFIGIGRFVDKKAPYYTIMAFSKVAKHHPDAQLLLAGDGMLLNMCQNLVRHYGLEKQVQFLGVVTPQEYRQLLSKSLAFVQHSITSGNGDMEGTPLAVLEASVAGLPVVSTYHAGISDVIIHGETGLLCDEHDVSGMAGHMLQLLDDVGYAKQLGAAAKLHILQNFGMANHIANIQTILDQAVKIY